MSRRALIPCLLLLAAGATHAQDDLTWRRVNPDNIVIMDLAEGRVVFELNPLFAPKTVDEFKRQVAEDFYRGLSFYRVIDGFVAQAGNESDIEQPDAEPGLAAEFELPRDDELAWTPVQENDLFAPETGFIDGFAAARDEDAVWLTHCPGVLAMARGNAADSGSTDFYIVIGQAPRYLDRNLTVFGRVIHGMHAVQRINRGPVMNNGIISSDLARSRIQGMRLATGLVPAEQLEYYVQDTNGKGFRSLLDQRRDRRGAFFHHPPPRVLDVCQVPVGAREEKPSS